MNKKNDSKLPAPYVNARLSKVFDESPELIYDSNSRLVFMSDCHRGIGNNADNFVPNLNIFYGALTYYNCGNYTYFELGDGDELWENRRINDIFVNHCDTLALISEFYKDGRFYMIHGNHDMVKKQERQRRLMSHSYNDCIRKKNGLLFPGIQIYEGLILKDIDDGHKIFLAHGHQGDFMNDYLWVLSRFLVRYLWRPLQMIGVENPINPSITNKKGGILEQNMMRWTKENRQMLICGHTHRPSFPERDDIPYFNDGCCVHPHYITAIEIQKGRISLVKWSKKTDDSLSLYIGRDVLYGPKRIRDFALAKPGKGDY